MKGCTQRGQATEWLTQRMKKPRDAGGAFDRRSAAGEVHGDFEADTQVGVGRFGPHRQHSLTSRNSPAALLYPNVKTLQDCQTRHIDTCARRIRYTCSNAASVVARPLSTGLRDSRVPDAFACAATTGYGIC